MTMQRLKEQRQAVVAERVSPADAAATIRQLSDSIHLWAHNSGTAHRSNSFPLWQPQVDSVARTEYDALELKIDEFCERSAPESDMWLDTNPARNITWWSMDVIRRYWLSTIGALSGAASLLPEAGQVRAPIILARVGLEALATIGQIADPDISSRERLRRNLNLRLVEVYDSDTESDAEDFRSTDELIAFAEHLGFSVTISKKRWVKPNIKRTDGKRESTAATIEEMLPGWGRDMWNTQSAIAHSRDPKTLLADEYGPLQTVEPWQSAETSAINLLAVVMPIEKITESVSAHTGWPAFADQATLDACVAALYSCSGSDDERIGAALGFEN